MEASILKSTKKILGLADDYTAFDIDVLTWINSAFSTLRDFGLGSPGFFVEDDSTTWADFGEDADQTNMIKTYVYLRTKIMFDPPATAFVQTSMEKQISEQEWRLSNYREARDWVPEYPDPEEPEL